MIINTNNYSVLEIIQMLDRRDLLVNKDYQRGSGIWPAGPSSYFIDTILENFPFPKIYMFEFLDREHRGVRKEIVDGQQRIGTILRFYNNEFALTGDSVFSGMKFNDLEQETQDSFLSYTVSVDVIRNASRTDILQMFRRMNAFTLPLNEAEKRHSSFQGEFKWFVNHLADELNEVFLEYGVFSNRQIVRMSDAAFVADSILAFERGILSSSPKDLRSLYKNFDENIGHVSGYEEYLSQTFSFITEHFSELRRSFMMKPYALHSLITAMVHNKYGIPAIENELGVGSSGTFAKNPQEAEHRLVSLALAHEAKEIEGPYRTYVWGCLSTTDRKKLMPTSLNKFYSKLVARTAYLDKAFDRHTVVRAKKQKIDRYAIQEGLVSALWQAWCQYCRKVVLHSVKGAVTLSGSTTTCAHSGLSDLEIFFLAKQLGNKANITKIKAIKGNYQEPTWGDAVKLNLIVNGMGTSNSSDLVQAFSACLLLKDLQLCRNASAHISQDLIQSVAGAKVRYVSTDFRHPSDLIFWIDPANQSYLWKSWISEMRLVAQLAIK